jgi:hypothetical protein
MKNEIHKLLEKFANEGSHWQYISSLFRPAVTRFFVTWFALAPAVVGVISGMPEQIIAPFPGGPYQLNVSLPFSWQILWWASFLYAVAFLLYQVFCPGFIKKYPSFKEYADRNHSARWLVWEVYYSWLASNSEQQQKLANRLITKGYATKVEGEADIVEPRVGNAGTAWRFTSENVVYEIQVNETETEARQRDLFWEVFGRFSATSLRVRYAIWISLTFAAALVLITVAQNVISVLSFLFGC